MDNSTPIRPYTPAERVAIYEWVKRSLLYMGKIEPYPNEWICEKIAYDRCHIYGVFTSFRELIFIKPADKNPFETWWDITDNQSRIKALDKMIALAKMASV